MAYFWIEAGLRGAYADGNGFIIKADTRKELKAAIESEAYYIKDAGFVGMNKREIARVVAHAWRDKKNWLPYVIPYGYKENYHSGIHIGRSTRSDYLEYMKESM